MTTPDAFDRLVLLAQEGKHVLPGVPRVKVKREPREDAVEATGESGQQVTRLGDDTAEVTVEFTFWNAEQYRELVALLKVLRVKAGEKPRVYDAVHPTLQAHGIRKLRLTGIADEGYTPREGYKVLLSFTEFYRPKASPVQNVGSETAANSELNGPAGGGTSPAPAAAAGPKGAAIADAAAEKLLNGTSAAGQCSAWGRETYQAGLNTTDRSLFGGTARATEGNFARANLSRPYAQVGYGNLRPGDYVFYGNESPPDGHLGVYMGQGMVAGNNFVTYKQRRGQFNAQGRPTGFDAEGRKVDSRGLVPIGALGTPTSIGRVDGFAGTAPVKPIIGPAIPLPGVVTVPKGPRG